MGKSQFDPELKLPPNVAQVSEAERTLNVGGPLNIAAPEEYEHPIHIRFQVVQVPRGEHDRRCREARARPRRGGHRREALARHRQAR